MLSIICFSKDRPLQLEAYIESVLFYSGLEPSSLNILYADSSAINYKRLIKDYPEVNWLRETNFHADLIRLIETAQDYVLLGCDDIFFTDYFDPCVPVDMLTENPDLFGFSLRLGLNLEWLPDLNLDGEVARWKWRSASNGHWNYPWDVSASVYRRAFILDYLRAYPAVTSPNRFEGFLADSLKNDTYIIGSELACFKRSKCILPTVNRVQDEFPNHFDDSGETNIFSLYQAHISGQRLDWPSFFRVENRVIHVDSRFFLIRENIALPSPLEGTGQAGVIQELTSHICLRLRLFYWRVRSVLRPLIPHWFRVLAQRLVRAR